MRAVRGELISSKPISLSKAAVVLSRFAASETGARPDVAAYLRRSVTAFNDLVALHREIRAHRKVPRVEEKEGATTAENNSRWMKKKKKKKKKRGSHDEPEPRVENSILELQGEVDENSKKVETLRSEKKSEERRYWKENKRKEDRLQEVDGMSLVSKSVNTEKKKRKHSDAQLGEVNGEIEQHEGKKKRRRRIIE